MLLQGLWKVGLSDSHEVKEQHREANIENVSLPEGGKIFLSANVLKYSNIQFPRKHKGETNQDLPPRVPFDQS